MHLGPRCVIGSRRREPIETISGCLCRRGWAGRLAGRSSMRFRFVMLGAQSRSEPQDGRYLNALVRSFARALAARVKIDEDLSNPLQPQLAFAHGRQISKAF